MKNLYKLKKSEYKHGATLSLENAKNHFEVAEKAAELGHFGIATSMLIIASEELAKASILKIKSIDNSIRIDNLEEYFRSHAVKHQSIFKIFLVSFEFMHIENSDTESESVQTKSDNPEKSGSEYFWIVLIVVAVIIGIIIYFTKDENISDAKKQEKSLEELRKQGFYLGFDSENRKWESPNETFDEISYDNFKESVELAFSTIEDSLFGDKINSHNIIEFADKLEDEKIVTEHIKELKTKIS